MLGVAWLLCSCADRKPAPRSLGPTQAPGYIAPAILSRAVDFRGTCSWGRAPGDPRNYRVRLRARKTASGTILVRASALFDPVDRSNILGELISGSTALGDGPVYDSRTGRRGYAIVVRGNDGRVCRGYVTENSVFTE